MAARADVLAEYAIFDNRVWCATMARIVVFAPVGALASSVSLANDILGPASAAAQEAGHRQDDVLLASLDGESVTCRGGLVISCQAGIDDIGAAALVWVAGYATPLIEGARQNAAVIPWLAQQHSQGALIAAHGPATFLLAEAGLLDARIATTYRPLASEFRRHHPQVDLRPDRLITDAGGVYCCVGLNSAADLLVSLVGKLYGRTVAASVGAWALVDSQRSYRLASTAFDGMKYHKDADVLEIQTWIEENYGNSVTISEIAATFTMSTRTLIRRFQGAVGMPPSEYLARVRIEAAKDLLRNSRMTVSEIVAAVGYRDIGAFYDLFAKHTGTRPGELRSTATPP
jgi:transcriptional regulator GlxA family with amidase domain